MSALQALRTVKQVALYLRENEQQDLANKLEEAVIVIASKAASGVMGYSEKT